MPTWMRKAHRSSSRPTAWPAGKGVVVAMTLDEAHQAIDAMLTHNTLGVQYDERGPRVVIEEFMDGEEASFIVMADGRHALPLATSQDHKRLKDADLGPNTGGMGAYSPAPVVTPEVHARVMREIISPTLAGMAADGLPYTGFLYAGLMIDGKGAPRVVEFNCRMGDPETQPIMMRLKSDLVDLVEAAIAGKLDKIEAEWDRRFALGVVMAAAGYPDSPRKGDVIRGLNSLRLRRRARLPRRYHRSGRRSAHQRWPRTVRHRPRRQREERPEARLRTGGSDPVRWHAVSSRHRLPRRGAQDLTPAPPGPC